MDADQGNPGRGPAATIDSPARARAGACYAIEGDLRYLSHHDEMRMLVRACVRAGWPLLYSRGFNPQPRVSIPLPRPVGTEAAQQWAIVALREAQPEESLFASLASQMPRGCRLQRVVCPAPARAPHARRVACEVTLDAADCAGLDERVAALWARDSAVVPRRGAPGAPPGEIDVRPHLAGLALRGTTLMMVLSFDGQRTARPAEVLSALGLDGDRFTHRVRRTDVQWDTDLSGPAERPASLERKTCGKKEENIGQAARRRTD